MTDRAAAAKPRHSLRNIVVPSDLPPTTEPEDVPRFVMRDLPTDAIQQIVFRLHTYRSERDAARDIRSFALVSCFTRDAVREYLDGNANPSLFAALMREHKKAKSRERRFSFPLFFQPSRPSQQTEHEIRSPRTSATPRAPALPHPEDRSPGQQSDVPVGKKRSENFDTGERTAAERKGHKEGQKSSEKTRRDEYHLAEKDGDYQRVAPQSLSSASEETLQPRVCSVETSTRRLANVDPGKMRGVLKALFKEFDAFTVHLDPSNGVGGRLAYAIIDHGKHCRIQTLRVECTRGPHISFGYQLDILQDLLLRCAKHPKRDRIVLTLRPGSLNRRQVLDKDSVVQLIMTICRADIVSELIFDDFPSVDANVFLRMIAPMKRLRKITFLGTAANDPTAFAKFCEGMRSTPELRHIALRAEPFPETAQLTDLS